MELTEDFKDTYKSDGIEHAKLMEDSGETPKKKISGIEDTRKKVYYFLEQPESKIAIFYHLINLLVIVGSILTSILSTIDTYEKSKTLHDLILYYELSLLSWISIEYMLRAWSCSFLGKYKGFFGTLKFMKSLYMLVDAFVIVSTLTTAILSIKTAYFSILRITRFLQIFRILRLDRQRGDLRTMARVVYKHRKELVTCYFVGFIILFGSTYLIYIIEKSSAKKSTIDNMANGLYWAMITVTSVGYGDISPETWAGKLLTGIFALVGCAFFALPAGILGSGFALQVAKQKKQKRYIKVRNPAAVLIQTFWRNHAVMPHKYHLQGTWFYFFPQILGRKSNPTYYSLLPGLQEIMLSDHFPEMMNKMVHEKHPQQKIRNGSTPSHEKGGMFRQRSNKGASNKKKHPFDMPLSTMLNKQYKEAIRFVLRVKLFHAVKVFKNVRYPFVNVQDIMEKNALCHTETLCYLKHIQRSLDEFRCELQEIRIEIQRMEVLRNADRMKVSESNPDEIDSEVEYPTVVNVSCSKSKYNSPARGVNSTDTENAGCSQANDTGKIDSENEKEARNFQSVIENNINNSNVKETAEFISASGDCNNNKDIKTGIKKFVRDEKLINQSTDFNNCTNDESENMELTSIQPSVDIKTGETAEPGELLI